MASASSPGGHKLGLLIHPKGSFSLSSLVSAGAADPRSIDTLKTLDDGEAFAFSLNGARLAVSTAAAVQIFDWCVIT